MPDKEVLIALLGKDKVNQLPIEVINQMLGDLFDIDEEEFVSRGLSE